tara:strand:- start:512 stop:1147 length:636 start_codon:yes stop_codon:yes gene_type:complete
MNVELIDSMGSDLTVANAARVSFGKKKVKFSKADERLINYLAKHNHWTPFGHCSLQFHMKAPVFVARQLGKHQVGLVWNEISRRYVDDVPECYRPENWRGRAEDKKQGSSEDDIVWERWLEYESLTKTLVGAYKRMMDSGICPEQARMILPQSMMTEWYWSGTLMAFARVCNLRCKEDVQKETRDLCWKLNSLVENIFPVSWKALRKEQVV